MLRRLLAIVLLLAACDPVAPQGAVDSPDAGALAEDAALPPEDAGDEQDSGSGPVDAGEPDAGQPDAGEAEADAGQADAGAAEDAGLPDDAGSADAGTICDTRSSPTRWVPCSGNAFVPDTPVEPWRHSNTEIFVVTQGAARHRGIDVIVNPGQEQLLVGKFAYGLFDKDLKDEKVEVWLETSCGRWERFATLFTSEEGQNGTVGGIADDGGRVFYRVPAERALPVGSYRVKMLVKGDHSSADFWLHVWRRGMRVVVSDIDGTITTRENDGLWTAFDPASVTARESSAATFRAYADKGYRVVFLTARPEFTTQATRDWFAANLFPEGVFHLSQADIGEHGAEAQTYKAEFLAHLAQGAGVVVEWAYGNKESDLEAYLEVGVLNDRIQLVAGEFTGNLQGANSIDGYVTEAARVGCLPPIEQ